MFKINHNINILKLSGSIYTINYFTSVVINEDNDNYTTTAQIVLPFKKSIINDYQLKDNVLSYDINADTTVNFNIGDRIDIQLYYNSSRNGDKKQFVGYISAFELTKENDIIIYCEDVMWLFKQFKVKFSYSDILIRTTKTNRDSDGGIARKDESKPTANIPTQYLTENIDLNMILIYLIKEMQNKLKDRYDISLLESITDDPNVTITLPYAPDINLGKIKINEYVTAVEVFDYIKNNFGVNVFTRNIYIQNTNAITRKANTITYQTKQVLYGGTKYPIIDEVTYPLLRGYSNEILVSEEGLVPGYNINLNSFIKNSTLNKSTDLLVIITSTQDNSNKAYSVATVDGINIVTIDSEIKKLIDSRNYKVELKIPNMLIDTMNKVVLDKWNNFEDNNFEGELEMLGLPIVRQGDKIKFSNDDIYMVKAVTTTCDSSNGFIQRVKLFNKLN